MYDRTEVTIEELDSNTLYYVTVSAKGNDCRIGDPCLASAVTRKYMLKMKLIEN